MSKKINPADQFQRFVGRPVKIIEKNYSRTNYKGETKEYVEETYDENDATISEIRVVARDADLKLRIWTPKTVGTMDFRTDRINVKMENVGEGFFQIKQINVG